MNASFHLKPLALAVLTMPWLLSSCGGGSSTSASTSGIVIGSYFEKAKVCIDQNSNGACDAGEVSTVTDTLGRYTLAAPGDVVAEIGTDAIQHETNGSVALVGTKFVLRAPKEATGIVSALSERVVVKMKAGANYDAALTQVASDLGVSKDKVLIDFNVKTGDAAADIAIKTRLKSESDSDLAMKDSTLGPQALGKIKNVVVIYAENRGFDNLFGLFPGANGIANALKDPKTYQQVDRDGTTVLATLPPVHNASTAQLSAWSFVSSLPNMPFQINTVQPGGLPGVGANVASPDLVHRFYNNQMQINGGKNDSFAAWSDAGGLSMGYYDGSSMAMWKLAQQYTLADNFYQGAFGGSFLNHFWLVCACTPAWTGTPPANRISSVDASGTRLNIASNSPVSALNGKPVYTADLNITPQLADGKYYAINTSQPPYQPSGTAPIAGGDARLADPTGAGAAGNIPLPAIDSTQVKTIGDTLTAKSVNWKWYAGAWNDSLANRANIYNNTTPNFQPHHQPFNYFNRFDPTTTAGAAERTAHLKDYTDLVADISAGSLPPVTFYKPQGSLNQHPGYTDVMSGDAHIADVITKLQSSPQWNNMLIVVTYDENGGFWDHATPPRGDQWGPGTRMPAIIISPYAKTGYVDSTPYDTTSIIKFITRRFGLDPLPGARKVVGDLSSSLDFSKP
jgi:acid phosphatase